MGWPAVSAPPKPGSAPPPQAPNPPNQDQIWHCTNFSSCEAGPNPPPPPLKLQLHDLKKRRVLCKDPHLPHADTAVVNIGNTSAK